MMFQMVLIFDVPMEAPMYFITNVLHMVIWVAIFISHNSGSNIPNGTSGSEWLLI